MVTTPQSGWASLASAVISPACDIPISTTAIVVLRLQLEQLQRHAEMIVQIALRFQHPMLCRQHMRDGFLGRRLARRTGHGDEWLSPQSADGGSEPLQCEKRVLHRQDLIRLREPRALVVA